MNRRYVWLGLSNIGTGVGTLIGSAMIAQMLGDVGKGEIALYTLAGLFAGMIADLGLSVASVYILRRQPTLRPAVHAVVLSWFLVGSVLAWAVCFAILLIATKGQVAGAELAFASLLAIPTLISGIARQILLADSHHKTYGRSVVLEAWSIPVLLLVAGLLTKPDTQLVTVLTLIGWTCAALYSVLSIRWMPALAHRSIFVRSVVSYGVPSHLGTVVQFANYRLDVFLTNAFAGAGALGIYSVAYNIAEILWRLPRLVALLLFPRIAASTPEDAKNFTVVLFRVMFVANLCVAAGTLAVAIPLIPAVFGQEFEASVQPLLILAPGVLAASCQLLLVEHLKGRGASSTKLHVAAVGLLVTLLVGVPTIIRFGSAGAAMTSTVAYIASAIVAAELFRRHTGVSYRSLFIPAPSDLAKLRGMLSSS